MRRFSRRAPCVVPDISAQPDGDSGWKLWLNDHWIGTIEISHYYTQLLRSADDPDARSYLSNRLQHAKQLMAAIERRRDTTLQIARTILTVQDGFFPSRRSVWSALSGTDRRTARLS